MADAAIKGAKGVSHSYHKINGPLGLLTRKVQQNCQEGQASAHKILAPFWISAAFRRPRGPKFVVALLP
jgi:hypothetical protein